MKNEITRNTNKLILSMLTMLFVTLRLCGIIDWHWIWILSPVWIPILFFLLLGIFSLFFGSDDDDDKPSLDDKIARP